MQNLKWRKANRSGAGNDCVELAHYGSELVIRDSKNPNAGTLFAGRSLLALARGL